MTKKEKRELIRMKFNNKCTYCGDQLQKGWHVDELLPVRRGWRWKTDENNDPIYDEKNHKIKEYYMEHPERLHIDNQMPSCPSCNINKHSMNLEEFRKLIEGFRKHLNEVSTQYKISKRYGLVSEVIKPVVFHFEK